MSTTINGVGASGAQYSFYLHPIGTAYHPVPGVYAFCKAAPNGNWDALYVGEAGNLDERLNTRLQCHQAWPDCLSGGATHIATMVVRGGEEARLSIETDLRHGLRPPYNRQ